jgi:hypothetical protein
MRRISHRDRDSIHRAEALARANPKFRPGFLSIDDFTASLENTDDLACWRRPKNDPPCRLKIDPGMGLAA